MADCVILFTMFVFCETAWAFSYCAWRNRPGLNLCVWMPSFFNAWRVCWFLVYLLYLYIVCVFVLLLLRRWFICYGKADNRVSRGLNKWHLIDRKSPKFPHTLRIHISRKFSSKRWKQFKHNNNNQNVKWMREKNVAIETKINDDEWTLDKNTDENQC